MEDPKENNNDEGQKKEWERAFTASQQAENRRVQMTYQRTQGHHLENSYGSHTQNPNRYKAQGQHVSHDYDPPKNKGDLEQDQDIQDLLKEFDKELNKDKHKKDRDRDSGGFSLGR